MSKWAAAPSDWQDLLGGAVKQRNDIVDRSNRVAALGERQQLLGQGTRTTRRFPSLFDHRQRDLFIGQDVLQQRQVIGDRGQNVVEVVGRYRQPERRVNRALGRAAAPLPSGEAR